LLLDKAVPRNGALQSPFAIKVRLCKSLISNDWAVLEFNGESITADIPLRIISKLTDTSLGVFLNKF
jgi:hypothetical protein